MSNSKPIKFEGGRVWGVNSFVNGDAAVAIPVDQLGGLSDESIGRMVRTLIPYAVDLMSDELLNGYGLKYLKNCPSEYIKGWLAMLEDNNIGFSDNTRELHNQLIREAADRVSAESRVKNKKIRRKGFVYLAYSETGHYKIGISKKPKERIKIFDTIMPINVSLIHVFEADDAKTAETALHTWHDQKRHNGEWFNLDDNDIEVIKSIQYFKNNTFIMSD